MSTKKSLTLEEIDEVEAELMTDRYRHSVIIPAICAAARAWVEHQQKQPVLDGPTPFYQTHLDDEGVFQGVAPVTMAKGFFDGLTDEQKESALVNSGFDYSCEGISPAEPCTGDALEASTERLIERLRNPRIGKAWVPIAPLVREAADALAASQAENAALKRSIGEIAGPWTGIEYRNELTEARAEVERLKQSQGSYVSYGAERIAEEARTKALEEAAMATETSEVMCEHGCNDIIAALIRTLAKDKA